MSAPDQSASTAPAAKRARVESVVAETPAVSTAAAAAVAGAAAAAVSVSDDDDRAFVATDAVVWFGGGGDADVAAAAAGGASSSSSGSSSSSSRRPAHVPMLATLHGGLWKYTLCRWPHRERPSTAAANNAADAAMLPLAAIAAWTPALSQLPTRSLAAARAARAAATHAARTAVSDTVARCAVAEGATLARASETAAAATALFDAAAAAADADGAATPAAAADTRALPWFVHNDAACAARGAAAENDFCAAMAAAGRARSSSGDGGGSGWHAVAAAGAYEYWNVRRHVDWMLRGDLPLRTVHTADAAVDGGSGSGSGSGSGDGSGAREMWVDVKALRATRRGAPRQNSHAFMELRDRGFLEGDADVLALEVFNADAPECAADATAAQVAAAAGLPRPVARAYVLLDRAAAAHATAALLEAHGAWDHAPCQFAGSALYRVYSRRAGDYITLLPLRELYAGAGAGVLLAC